MVVSSEGYRSWLPWHSSLVPTFVPDDVTSPAYTAAAPLGLMLSSADGIWLVQAGEVFLLGASLSVPHGVYLQNCWAVVAEGSVPLCTNLLVRSSAPFLFFLPFRCCGWGPPYSWGCSCKTLKKKKSIHLLVSLLHLHLKAKASLTEETRAFLTNAISRSPPWASPFLFASCP